MDWVRVRDRVSVRVRVRVSVRARVRIRVTVGVRARVTVGVMMIGVSTYRFAVILLMAGAPSMLSWNPRISGVRLLSVWAPPSLSQYLNTHGGTPVCVCV